MPGLNPGWNTCYPHRFIVVYFKTFLKTGGYGNLIMKMPVSLVTFPIYYYRTAIPHCIVSDSDSSGDKQATERLARELCSPSTLLLRLLQQYFPLPKQTILTTNKTQVWEKLFSVSTKPKTETVCEELTALRMSLPDRNVSSYGVLTNDPKLVIIVMTGVVIKSTCCSCRRASYGREEDGKWSIRPGMTKSEKLATCYEHVRVCLHYTV